MAGGTVASFCHFNDKRGEKLGVCVRPWMGIFLQCCESMEMCSLFLFPAVLQYGCKGCLSGGGREPKHWPLLAGGLGTAKSCCCLCTLISPCALGGCQRTVGACRCFSNCLKILSVSKRLLSLRDIFEALILAVPSLFGALQMVSLNRASLVHSCIDGASYL